MNTPYGGKLVNRFTNAQAPGKDEVKGIVDLPFIDFYLDSVKIAEGAYSPLDSFQGSEEFSSVINNNTLNNGLPWTIPIIYTTNEETWKKMKHGDDLFLLNPKGEVYGFLNIEEKFKINRKEFALKVYGTIENAHPNVNDIFNSYTEFALSGKVTLFSGVNHENYGENTPSQIRDIFSKRGWKGIAAYQARNPPHVAHEYLQKSSLENPEIDGLFIHIVVGRLKKGDYKSNVIIESYKALIENYHRTDKVVFSPLNITMRYGGPKAALFLAIIRRNYGATHYIVGRDQAGVGKYYDPYAAHAIFDKYDIGVKPLKFTETFYCKKCKGITSDRVCPHDVNERMIISQTKIREMLQNGETIPDEIIRPEVAKVLYGKDVLIQ